MDVLIHISQQISNLTTPAFEPTAFKASSNVTALNTLFFLSLTLVLIDACLAMIVKGWLQEFDRGWRKYNVAHLRAQERERRLREFERWKLPELVALLPILIQVSLLLFFAGFLVLIFPVSPSSAVWCSVAFSQVLFLYGFSAWVSIVNTHAPFYSPDARSVAREPASLPILSSRITHTAQLVASASLFRNRLPLPTPGHQANTDAPDEKTQPLPSNNGVAEHATSHNPVSVEKSGVGSGSHSGIDPQMHVQVLERLVTGTYEVVENIPIFLELLDQPVKYPMGLRPGNVEKWRELLRITLRLLGDQSPFSVSAACTLARTMMICSNHETPDERLFFTLEHHLDSRDTDDQRSRIPLNVLFASYLPYWLGNSTSGGLWRMIAFLEPSNTADAELLWMVDTFHRTMDFKYILENGSEHRLHTYLGFFVAVLTYVSSTEQSRRSKVPLTDRKSVV